MTIKEFNALQRQSYKSLDTEEWLDIYFTRPIGLVMALVCRRLKIHPNAITVFSFFLGAAAGWMFYHTDLWSNVCGVLLLMAANFCDSADGQLARINNQKTLTGRMLDGFASDVWFFSCYVAIAMRIQGELIPGTDYHWGLYGWLMCAMAGLAGHAPQCRLADYYRQIHLFFLLGKEGSELNTYASQRAIYEGYRKERNLVGMLFFYNYANYCKAQEKQTPQFQKLYKALNERYGGIENVPQEMRDEIRTWSLPLMKYTNILTHNSRAIALFVGCLTNMPWIYPVFELTVLLAIYVHMHRTHERKSLEMYRKVTLPAFLFDYGGTLDTRGNHWGKVIWHAYQQCSVPVTETDFREAYVYAERKLGSERIIMPDFTFCRTLDVKIDLQMRYLLKKGLLDEGAIKASQGDVDDAVKTMHDNVVETLYRDVCEVMEESREVLSSLSECRKVLVSNFYGNVETVLREFRLEGYFEKVIESAVVGIRKPDPRIFALGVEALGMKPEDVIVVGDSLDKDIIPAKSLGCRTVWFRGEPWNEAGALPSEEKSKCADIVISNLKEIKRYI